MVWQNSNRERRLGFVCDCGALTPNTDAICDDCFQARWKSRLLDQEITEENARFERSEHRKMWFGGGALIFGFTFFLVALYWSMWHD